MQNKKSHNIIFFSEEIFRKKAKQIVMLDEGF